MGHAILADPPKNRGYRQRWPNYYRYPRSLDDCWHAKGTAIGASNIKVMFQFMVEATTLTVLGAVIGIILGVVAGNPITHLLVTNSTSSSTSSAGGFTAGGGSRGGGRGFGIIRSNVSSIHAAIGWSIILDGLAAAIIIAVVGSALASFFIAKI